jgi:D-hexose-6-phosphate mutarotase
MILPEGARLESGPGGLQRLGLATPAGEARLFLQGATVVHFQPAGQRPILWLSEKSRFEAGKGIRGGVPICFPWFGPRAGDPKAPSHGYARTAVWTLRSVDRSPDGLTAALDLPADAGPQAGFPTGLQASLAVTVGATLRLALTVVNHGAAPEWLEAALHTYLTVSDVRSIRIHGLEGVGYIDKTADMARRTGEPEPFSIRAETDRVYVGTAATVTVEDPGWNRRIAIAKAGSASTVVWNPWIAKAKALADFGDDEWTAMVCVETANALDDAVTLAPGATLLMSTTIG